MYSPFFSPFAFLTGFGSFSVSSHYLRSVLCITSILIVGNKEPYKVISVTCAELRDKVSYTRNNSNPTRLDIFDRLTLLQCESAILNPFPGGIAKQSFSCGGNPELKTQKGVCQQVFMQFKHFCSFLVTVDQQFFLLFPSKRFAISSVKHINRIRRIAI